MEELISLPENPDLIAQLSLPLYHYTETGKVQLESKREMQMRGVTSPDFADALVLAFAPGPGSWVQAAAALRSEVNRYDNW